MLKWEIKLSMKHHLKEIEAALSAYPKRTSAHNPEAYIGGGQSKLRYIGLRVPHLRETLKKGFSFSGSEKHEVAKVWDFVWQNSDCYEVMALALAWFEHKQQSEILEAHWPHLKKWSSRIDNWAHSDSLSGIYAKILEGSPGLAYPTFQEWSDSKNPWLRRLSIVSLIYYSRARKNVLPYAKVIALVEAQMDFDHYYVQKGVGWTLRELGNVYPEQTFRYLEKNIRRLSAHAFSAATEKLSKADKDRLKKLRKG